MNGPAQLLSHAPDHILVPLLERCSADLRGAILAGTHGADRRVVDAVITRGSPVLRHTLAANQALAPEDLERLADRADGRTAWRLALHPRVHRDLMVRVMAMADPGRALLDSRPYDRTRHEQYALVESPDAAYVVHGLRGIFRDGTLADRAVVLRAGHNLLRLLGPERGHAMFARHGTTLGKKEADVVARAFRHSDGPGILHRLSTFKARKRPLIAQLRRHDTMWLSDEPTGYRPPSLLHPSGLHLLLLAPHVLDWDELMRCDAQLRWGTVATLILGDQPGCPDEFRARADVVRADPRTTGVAADPARVLTPWWFRVPPGPTAATLAGVPPPPPAPPALRPYEHLTPEARAHALGTLAAASLGDRIDAWLVALRLLPDFPGSLPELLDTSTRATV
ncbi:hypothetical protein [Streptodolium elevatio]